MTKELHLQYCSTVLRDPNGIEVARVRGAYAKVFTPPGGFIHIVDIVNGSTHRSQGGYARYSRYTPAEVGVDPLGNPKPTKSKVPGTDNYTVEHIAD